MEVGYFYGPLSRKAFYSSERMSSDLLQNANKNCGLLDVHRHMKGFSEGQEYIQRGGILFSI